MPNFRSRVSPNQDLLNHLLTVRILPDPNDILAEEGEGSYSENEDDNSIISASSSDSNNCVDIGPVNNVFTGFP